MNVGGLCRAFDCCLFVRLQAIGDIFGDRDVEKRRHLADDRHRGAQRAEMTTANVDAVDTQRPSLHVVKALKQRDERRLAAARATDDRDALALTSVDR